MRIVMNRGSEQMAYELGFDVGSVLERTDGITRKYGVVVGRVTYKPAFEKAKDGKSHMSESLQYMVKRLKRELPADYGFGGAQANVLKRYEDSEYEIWSSVYVQLVPEEQRRMDLVSSPDPQHKEPKSKLAMYGYTAIRDKVRPGKRERILEMFCKDFSPKEAYDIISSAKRRGKNCKSAIEIWESDLKWIEGQYPEECYRFNNSNIYVADL